MKLVLFFSLCCVVAAQATMVQVTNDTQFSYFVMYNDVGNVLSSGEYCVFDVPKQSWWHNIIKRPSIVLYRRYKDGRFIKKFTVHPYAEDDERIDISMSEVHHQVKADKVPFSVRADKKGVVQAVQDQQAQSEHGS